MTDLKPAAEVARELADTIAHIERDVSVSEVLAQALTARDLAVARRVIEACEDACGVLVKHNRRIGHLDVAQGADMAADAIRALDPAKILEAEDETE